MTTADADGNRRGGVMQVTDERVLRLLNSQEFSASVWFKGSQQDQVLLSTGSWQSMYISNYEWTPGVLDAWVGGARYHKRGVFPEDDQWHRLGVTVDCSVAPICSAIFYIDGVKVADDHDIITGTNSFSSLDITSLYLGALRADGYHPHTGLFDDLKLYAGDLPPHERTPLADQAHWNVTPTNSGWQWQQVSDASAGAFTKYLAPGTYTVTVHGDTAGTLLDQLLITDRPEILGGGDDPLPSEPDTHYTLKFEAEAGAMTAPMRIVANERAFGGQYIDTTTGSAGTATYQVEAPVAGTYYLWARAYAADSGHNSLAVEVDGGTMQPWEIPAGQGWTWFAMGDGGVGPISLELSAGSHTIVIEGREPNAQLDRLVVTTDPNFAPSTADEGIAAEVTHAYGYDGVRVKTVGADGREQIWFSENITERNGVREHYVKLGDRVIAKVSKAPDEDGAGSAGGGAAAMRAYYDGNDAAYWLRNVLLVCALLLLLYGLWQARGSERAWAQAAASVALSGMLVAGCSNVSRVQQHLWSPAEVLYFHTGTSSGPFLFTDELGCVVEERRFSPFGEELDAWMEIVPDHTGGTTGKVNFRKEPYNSLNKQTDADTGWSYHGARWMAPETARWLTPDPPVKAPDPKFMADPWSLHPYQYVSQNPVVFWDPDGNERHRFVVARESKCMVQRETFAERSRRELDNPQPAVRRHNPGNYGPTLREIRATRAAQADMYKSMLAGGPIATMGGMWVLYRTGDYRKGAAGAQFAGSSFLVLGSMAAGAHSMGPRANEPPDPAAETANGARLLTSPSPITIPRSARPSFERKNGYFQLKFRWKSSSGVKMEARFHGPTPGAPNGSVANWRVTRTFPGNSRGLKKGTEQLVRNTDGSYRWVSEPTWRSAIDAYRAGSATDAQREMLKGGHM